MQEEKTLILLSRYELTDIELKKIRDLIAQGVDWYRLFILAVNNKVVGLVYYNLYKYGLFERMKPILLYLMKYYYVGNRERNKFILQEKQEILSAMNENGVNILALKGGVLLESVYKDYGSRTCNDLDFFCCLKDVNKIDEVVRKLGYIQGEYDWRMQCIVDFSRVKKTGWKMNMNTIPTYIKKIEGNEFIDFLELDFSYAFDLRKDVSISEDIFSQSMNNEMSTYDSIIYLCSHLYKEAENDIWIDAKADLNLIKFCDVREACKNLNEANLELLVRRSMQIKCAEAVFYCAYYLFIIYEEEFFQNIMLCFKKNGYMLKKTKYDKLDFMQSSRNRFMKRLFSYDNANILIGENFIKNKNIIEKGEE